MIYQVLALYLQALKGTINPPQVPLDITWLFGHFASS